MKKNVALAAGVVLMMNLATKILGFVRETVNANAFGAKGPYDAYLVAYTLPYFLQAVLGFALVTAVVPVLTRYLVEDDRDQAWHVASSVLNLTALVLALLTAIGMAGAGYLVRLTAPGFNPELAGMATTLTRIMFPSLVFMGVGMVITGVLNACQKFAVPAFAPGFSNMIIIVSVIFFAGRYGVTALAVGTLASFFGLLILQLGVLKRIGFRYRFSFDYRHPAVRQVMLSITPIALGVAVNQIYFALNRIFASSLAEGSISALNYANQVVNLPLGVFVAAVATAIYPTLATQAIKGERSAMADTMLRGLGMVSLITVPAAVGLMVLREPIIQLLFERGAFDHQATVVTATALLYFSICIFPASANMIINRAYFAVGDVRTPLLVGAASIGVNLGLSFLLLPLMGHGGLALANSLAMAANTLFLYWGLKNHLPRTGVRPFLVTLMKIGAACVLMAICAGATTQWLQGRMDFSQGHQLALAVLLAIAAGGFSYLLAILLLRVDDVRYLQELVRRKLKK